MLALPKRCLRLLELRHKTADNNYAQAQYNLAFCYYAGLGVEVDDAQMLYWYRKAAEQGYESAIDWLYEEENEVPNVSPSNG